MSAGRTPRNWERYAWAAGILFVVALLGESIIATGIGLTHEETPASVAGALDEHRTRLLLISYFSIIYATAFVVYLWKLYEHLRGDSGRPEPLSVLVLIGGILFVTLHAVSDIGLTGLLGSKLSINGAQLDQGIAYTLYFTTYVLDSVGDVFGSLFMLATGLIVFRTGLLPRWLAWIAFAVAALFFLQGFGLGGVINTFGLVLDLIGFLLFLTFIVASSVVGLRGDAQQGA
jgi:hypothetical protein